MTERKKESILIKHRVYICDILLNCKKWVHYYPNVTRLIKLRLRFVVGDKVASFV